MYVCVCNAIREADFRKAGKACAGNAEAVYASLGKIPQCRQCLDDADDILQQERGGTVIPFRRLQAAS